MSETETNEPQQTIADVLRQFEGAPTQSQIEQWKTKYGDVFVSGFSETELFVWRAITRPEYVEVQKLIASGDTSIDQYRVEEIICEKAVLWTSREVDWSKGKAGTPATLSEQIMSNSNFLNPQAAAMLVAKL